MYHRFKILDLLLLSSWLFFPFLLWGSGQQPVSVLHPFHSEIIPVNTKADTVKYRGYRLELIRFRVDKRKGDWLKMDFVVVNSGRRDVDLTREGTEHWVQYRFGPSLFEEKLGGFRDHIIYALVKEGFQLAAGEKAEVKGLKVPQVLPYNPNRPLNTAPESVAEAPSSRPKPEQTVAVAEERRPVSLNPAPEEKDDTCPDIYFEKLSIIEEDDKWATLTYTIANGGSGSFYLFGKSEAQEDHLTLAAYISGVETLTRGALPIGGQELQKKPGIPDELKPGQQFTGQIKLDIRKKTRYMKSLILSLESNQYLKECDKANNDSAVILK